jgi:hypothetical protein
MAVLYIMLIDNFKCVISHKYFNTEKERQIEESEELNTQDSYWLQVSKLM